MTDQPIRVLWSRRECIAHRRCPDCGWHIATMGHHPDCPTTKEVQQ